MSNYKLCTLVVFGTRPDATKLATVVQELGKQSDAFMVRSLLFAPIETARDNLLREGISDIKIMATGNTAIDALLTVIDLG